MVRSVQTYQSLAAMICLASLITPLAVDAQVGYPTQDQVIFLDISQEDKSIFSADNITENPLIINMTNDTGSLVVITLELKTTSNVVKLSTQQMEHFVVVSNDAKTLEETAQSTSLWVTTPTTLKIQAFGVLGSAGPAVGELLRVSTTSDLLTVLSEPQPKKTDSVTPNMTPQNETDLTSTYDHVLQAIQHSILPNSEKDQLQLQAQLANQDTNATSSESKFQGIISTLGQYETEADQQNKNCTQSSILIQQAEQKINSTVLPDNLKAEALSEVGFAKTMQDQGLCQQAIEYATKSISDASPDAMTSFLAQYPYILPIFIATVIGIAGIIAYKKFKGGIST